MSLRGRYRHLCCSLKLLQPNLAQTVRQGQWPVLVILLPCRPALAVPWDQWAARPGLITGYWDSWAGLMRPEWTTGSSINCPFRADLWLTASQSLQTTQTRRTHAHRAQQTTSSWMSTFTANIMNIHSRLNMAVWDDGIVYGWHGAVVDCTDIYRIKLIFYRNLINSFFMYKLLIHFWLIHFVCCGKNEKNIKENSSKWHFLDAWKKCFAT